MLDILMHGFKVVVFSYLFFSLFIDCELVFNVFFTDEKLIF